MREASEIESELLEIWRKAYQGLRPGKLACRVDRRIAVSEDTALLFWGKSAIPTLRGLFDARSGALPPTLVISPEHAPGEADELEDLCRRGPLRWVKAQHPLPGDGSFRAGAALIDFFDALGRIKVRKLEVFLSGGASSLAWLRPARMDRDALLEKLRQLYARPLSIAELNAERARLCRLKGGGSARWLQALAPSVRARVWATSDVLPYGPEVIGSGPFWDGRIPHHVLADNRIWVDALVKSARASGERVYHASSAHLDDWSSWVRRATRAIRSSSGPGIWIWGGEPRVDLRGHCLSPRARGGRQAQIAAALLAANWDAVASGRVEILAMSSDGVDGRSGAAGAFVSLARPFDSDSRRARPMRSAELVSLRKALSAFDAATSLHALGFLVDARELGAGGFTNVQDTLLVRLRS